MSKITRGILVSLVLTTASALSCDRGTSSAKEHDPAATAASRASTVLATVNGVPITELDVDARLGEAKDAKAKNSARQMGPVNRKNTLETIIRDELVRQRAAELGLDADPDYQRRAGAMEAKVHAFKRRALGNLFYRRQIEDKAEVPEAEARKRFDEEAGRIRTELHVWQILRRGDAGAAKKLLDELKGGVPFEEVAKRQFPPLPAGQRPWDLGYLKWHQLPMPWQSVIYGLNKGEISGMIPGPRKRFWILKLIDKRETSDMTFELAKPMIMATMKRQKISQLRESTHRDLRSNAKIEYSKAPSPDAAP